MTSDEEARTTRTIEVAKISGVVTPNTIPVRRSKGVYRAARIRSVEKVWATAGGGSTDCQMFSTAVIGDPNYLPDSGLSAAAGNLGSEDSELGQRNGFPN